MIGEERRGGAEDSLTCREWNSGCKWIELLLSRTIVVCAEAMVMVQANNTPITETDCIALIFTLLRYSLYLSTIRGCAA